MTSRLELVRKLLSVPSYTAEDLGADRLVNKTTGEETDSVILIGDDTLNEILCYLLKDCEHD